MSDEKTCFVVCPIGDDGSDIRRWSDLTFNYIIKPVAESFGYCPKRADHIKESGMITSQIIEQLLESQLVIADLTNNNPNVYYELAIRHLTQKPYIQMIKIGQKVPFDVSGMRTIFFDTELELGHIAKEELSKQIESIEKNEFKAANPITLAHNYSIIQKILHDGSIELKDDGLSKVIIESINSMSFSLRELSREVSNLKDSRSYNKNLFDAVTRFDENSVKLSDDLPSLLQQRVDLHYELENLDKTIKSLLSHGEESDSSYLYELKKTKSILMKRYQKINEKIHNVKDESCNLNEGV